MNTSRLPTWVLVLIGIVAVVAGVLGVVHAPPATGKAVWSIVTLIGLMSLTLAVRRQRQRADKPR